MAPIEWLNGLVSDDRYRALVEEAGSLPAAAWKLARARCQVWETPTDVPTSREVRAAARIISRHIGLGGALPGSAALASECEHMGLLVL